MEGLGSVTYSVEATARFDKEFSMSQSYSVTNSFYWRIEKYCI